MIHVDSELLAWALSGLIIIGAVELVMSIGFVIYKLIMRMRGIIVKPEFVYYDANGEILEEDWD